MRLRSRLPALVAAGLVLAAIVGLVARADALLDLLAGSVARADAAVGNRLLAAGVLAYWDFDEVRPRNRVSGRDVETGGTRIVRGRYGSARAFRPGRQSFVRTDVPLPALGPRFTFSCWVRFPEKLRNQQVFQYLAIAGGKLVLRLPGQKPLAWPIEAAPGRFRHVAFTVDEATGTAKLYIDGEPQGSLALQPLVHKSLQLCFGQDRWTPPAAFALDEVSVWGRALSPEEVRALTRQRRSLGTSRAFARLAALYAARTLRDAYGALLLAVDLFNPLLHESRIYSAGLPSYALELSRNDVRHFNAWFNDTADNGLNAPATSDKRKVDLLVRGRRRSAVMELVAGRQTGPQTSSKRTFTLELLDADGEPERTLLLQPIEGAPYLLDALAAKLARDCGLPPVAPEIVAVSTNGSFDGLYLAADLSGDKGPFWRGEAEQWRELITRLPFFRDQLLAEFDRIAGRLTAPLCSDRKSPLTSREIVHEIRRQRRLLEDAALDRTPRSDEALVARVADFVREEVFLGDNPHASLIVGDLKFPPATVNGATLSFASLTPEVLSAAGRVTPQAGTSVTASLRVTVARGSATRTRDLSFGVPARRLPVLRVESEGDPRRAAAIPCVAELIEADGRRGGLREGKFRLRGNSVLVKNAGRKVYYRVEFDRPQEVPGIGRTRLLLLTSAWRDVALMRDRLVYDLFRSFSEPGKPRFAPHIRYVELVVNGDYKGIYNLTDRVDGDLLGFPKKAAGRDRPVLYKAKGGAASFTQIQRDAYVQKVPDWRGGEFWGPYDRLVRFVGNSTPAAFREGIEALVDVDEVMDFEILLLLRADMEGRNYNLYLARQGGPGARFFIVPWDADMSFYGTELASNALVHRLHADLPGYSRRVLERWRALRRERLSEQELMRRIGGLETELAEAVGRNYRRWPLAEGWTWERDVDTLKKYLRTRLALLDRTFEEAAAADAAAGRKTQ